MVAIQWPFQGKVDSVPRTMKRREHILIVDPKSYWYASLPVSELIGLDIRARYIPSSNKTTWLGALTGGAVFPVVMLGLMLLLLPGAVSFAIVASVMFGTPIGAAAGWWAGPTWGPKPLWVFRRINGELVAVYPSSMLQEQAGDGKSMVIRGRFLYFATKQVHAGRLFMVKTTKYRMLGMTALILLIVALTTIMFLFAMASSEPKKAETSNVETLQQ